MKWVASLLSILLLHAMAPAVGAAECTGRPLRAVDGGAADVDDCELAHRFEVAELRRHLAPCVQAMREADLRVYGLLRFSLELAPGGRLLKVEHQASAFDRTPLPRCAHRALWRRLNRRPGRSEGKAAQVGLSLRVDAEGFSLDLAADLAKQVQQETMKDRSPLPGGFRSSLTGPVSSCPVGRGRLFLRLESKEGARAHWVPEVQDEALHGLVQDCLEEVPAHGESRRQRRRRRRKESRCLAKLLEHRDPRVRALAADSIHDEWHWRARRALDKTGRKMVGLEDCQEPCQVKTPPGYWPGLALVRILRAQNRLKRRIRDEVLSAILAHDLVAVRLRFVRDVLRVWRGGLPDLLAPLYSDPDPRVRVHACQRACLEGKWEARRAFVELLRSTEPGLRAMALLHARACVPLEVEALRQALAGESEPALAALMRRALPGASPEQAEQALAGLLHPCPLVRHLSAGWLARLPQVPREPVQEALAREGDPLLKEGLRRLLNGHRGAQAREQIWWQDARP